MATAEPLTGERDPEDGEDFAEGEAGSVHQINFASLTKHVQSRSPSVPIANPNKLPLAELDPEVLERVCAEIVSRQNNSGAFFYGRRGQKQHGLDIVERHNDGTRSLYQVKRYQALTPALITTAFTDYTVAPRPLGTTDPPRRFDPIRFVVITSAEVDVDTANVDKVADLQDEYVDDLTIELWGSETLSRKLRDMPALVYAVFGPAWAEAFCGYGPAHDDISHPDPLGLVDNPITVLGLDALIADAERLEPTDPNGAAHSFGVAATALAEGNFPGHAELVRTWQARAALAGEDVETAFTVWFDLALDRIVRGEPPKPLPPALDRALTARLSPQQIAKRSLTEAIAEWHTKGSNLTACVPTLAMLCEEEDPHRAHLCCLLLEQAIVDGLYEFAPPRSLVALIDESTPDLLVQLRNLAAGVSDRNVLLRARLRCAVADSQLTSTASASEVESVYEPLLDQSSAGRYLRARGLITARAAYAFAHCGVGDRAENLWRRAVLDFSQDGYYGDALASIRSLDRVARDSGRFAFGLQAMIDALPTRRRILAFASDPLTATLAAAHENQLSSAFGNARRYWWEARIAGQLFDELRALSLFGDVLVSAGRPQHALEFYIRAGQSSAAGKLTAELPWQPETRLLQRSGLRRRRSAAIQVIGSQASQVPNEDVDDVIASLIEEASALWTAPNSRPCPERDALDAIAAFGLRIPESRVPELMTLTSRAHSISTGASTNCANLLVQAFWAVEPCRPEIAVPIVQMLQQDDPPHNLAGLIEGLNASARGPLLPSLLSMAEAGSKRAIEILASWGEAPSAVQVASRRACATLLSRAVGVERNSDVVGTQEMVTVDLLVALMHATDPISVSPEDISKVEPEGAGGTLWIASHQPSEPSTAEPPAEVSETGAAGADEIVAGVADLATGDSSILGAAVANRLLEICEDGHHGGSSRLSALQALRLLLNREPTLVGDDFVNRLLALSRDARLSEFDKWQIASDDPLSQFRFNSGIQNLGSIALTLSAEVLPTQTASLGDTEAQERVVDEILVASSSLTSSSDAESRKWGALAIAAVARAVPGRQTVIDALLFHSDPNVRATGVANAHFKTGIFARLATDPAVLVRMAVASRGRELPMDIQNMLIGDSNPAVARCMSRALD